MRVIFMGTPEFSVPALRAVAAAHEVVCVYTQPPRAAGRGQKARLSPVHAAAEELGLEVRHPVSLKDAGAQEAFAALGADVAVVVAYGLILPVPVLEAPRLGCLNIHASILPRWRGAAPVHRAIMAGDAETGVQVMRMERGLDTGPIAMTERVAITPGMTAGQLHDRLAPLGADLMGRAVAALARGSLQFVPQADTGVTYASKIDKSECRIDWSAPASTVHDRIRGLTPFPGAFFEADLGRGMERVRVSDSEVHPGAGPSGTVLGAGPEALTVACGDGAVAVRRLQRAGKPAMAVAEFLRGTPIAAGLRLGD